MKKIFLIGWKDVTLAFRDRAALVLMLAAPFLLTLGLGFVTGHFSGSNSSGVSHIPVALVNQDGGQLGNTLVDLFHSTDLANLVTAVTLADPTLARQQVDADQVAAAIIIPAGFTRSIIPAPGGSQTGPLVQIQLVINPTRPTSVGVITTILERFLSQVEVGRVAGQVAVSQLIGQGLVQPQQAPAIGAQVGARLGGLAGNPAIALKTDTSGEGVVTFDALAFMAPGMALMFLMFTVSHGGRSLLAERTQGTLPRLLVTPTRTSQVLGGKLFGIFLTGVAQMLILIGASALLFQLNWGSPLPVLVLVLAAVAGAMGWGMLITALARTPGQVSTVGSALMLTFGILGGSFIDISRMPAFFQVISKMTPNAWGLDGFLTLTQGGSLADILGPVAALLVMGAVLFAAAVLLINRRGVMQA
ncbi:MAG: ABC transporter permease [Anaerolineaceae bacterium]|nr:ABC transporter permease [Anaerolineaceae bacterium]